MSQKLDSDEWLRLQNIDPELFADAFSEEVWLNEQLYVWRASENELARIVDAVIHKTSPVSVVGGLWGVGKSAFIYAFKHLIESAYNQSQYKIVEVPIKLERTTDFGFLRNVADTMDLKSKFGGTYPRDRYAVLSAIEDSLRAYAKQYDIVTLIVDDSNLMLAEAYMSVKAICDFKENGRRICSVVLCGEYAKIDERLSQGELVQVKERAQERAMLRPFNEVEMLELIARAMAYAKGDPKDSRWRFDPTNPQDMELIKPFIPVTVRAMFEAVKGIPRYTKPVCRIAARQYADAVDSLPRDQWFSIPPSAVTNAVTEARIRRGEVIS